MRSRVQPDSYYPNWCLLSSSLKTPTRMSVARTKTTRCHGLHPRINQHHELMVDYWRCLIRTKNNHGHTWHPRSHWRWSFHANSKEVPSLTIKTADISLTNKEEQLSTMLLEDKDNQGGTWVCISNEPQLVNQGSTKIKKGWWKKSMQLDGAKKS